MEARDRERRNSADSIERGIANLYKQVRIPKGMRSKIEEGLYRLIAKREQESGNLAAMWSKRLARLGSEREKLLAAYYSDAIPLDVFKARTGTDQR